MHPIPKPALVADWQVRRDALTNTKQAPERLTLSWHYTTNTTE